MYYFICTQTELKFTIEDKCLINVEICEVVSYSILVPIKKVESCDEVSAGGVYDDTEMLNSATDNAPVV